MTKELTKIFIKEGQGVVKVNCRDTILLRVHYLYYQYHRCIIIHQLFSSFWIMQSQQCLETVNIIGRDIATKTSFILSLWTAK